MRLGIFDRKVREGGREGEREGGREGGSGGGCVCGCEGVGVEGGECVGGGGMWMSR